MRVHKQKGRTDVQIECGHNTAMEVAMSVHTIPQSKHGNRFIDMAGKRVGRLIVVSCAGFRHNQAMWLCRCDCGNETVVFGSVLRRDQKTQSCGCIVKEVMSKLKTTHGMSRTTEYRIWRGMINRCHKETDPAYSRYGGRGIVVCDKWRNSFPDFLEDMGSRPGKRYSLDRIDNDKGYSPENCRWATNKQQSNNRRNNHLITYDGETHTISEWADITGIKQETILNRLNVHNWSIEKTLSTPVSRTGDPARTK